jgi:hypothetical protein
MVCQFYDISPRVFRLVRVNARNARMSTAHHTADPAAKKAATMTTAPTKRQRPINCCSFIEPIVAESEKHDIE